MQNYYREVDQLGSLRRAHAHSQEGGSWEVRVSLAAVGQWICSLGRLDPATAFGQGRPMPPRTMPQAPEIAALTVPLIQLTADEDTSATQSESLEPKSKLTPTRRTMAAIRHAAILSETPVREEGSALRLDAHLPRWLPRDERESMT